MGCMASTRHLYCLPFLSGFLHLPVDAFLRTYGVLYCVALIAGGGRNVGHTLPAIIW